MHCITPNQGAAGFILNNYISNLLKVKNLNAGGHRYVVGESRDHRGDLASRQQQHAATDPEHL